MMNSIVTMTSILLVLSSSLIFTTPFNNVDKVFAQTGTTENNGSAGSRANTTVITATAVTSSLSPNLNTNDWFLQVPSIEVNGFKNLQDKLQLN
jgi:hypothetical protein